MGEPYVSPWECDRRGWAVAMGIGRTRQAEARIATDFDLWCRTWRRMLELVSGPAPELPASLALLAELGRLVSGLQRRWHVGEGPGVHELLETVGPPAVVQGFALPEWERELDAERGWTGVRLQLPFAEWVADALSECARREGVSGRVRVIAVPLEGSDEAGRTV